MPKQGEIVLIPVSFTDLSSNKRRPVIVISNDDYNQTKADMVVVAMTSNPLLDAYSFIVKPFGQVNARTLARIQTILRTLTARPTKLDKK